MLNFMLFAWYECGKIKDESIRSGSIIHLHLQKSA